MEFSKHNIISRIADSGDYYIVNLLSGNADILAKEEAESFLNNSLNDPAEFIKKGYLVDRVAEETLYRTKYLDFIAERESDEVQLFFTPWYSCNFSCSYCFQDKCTNQIHETTTQVIDAFLDYVSTEFVGRKKYVTIFGGEPLLSAPSKMKIIQYLIQECNRLNLDIAIVTNGYNIVDYIEILKNARIREMQVTLDGAEKAHDARRMLKGGKGTFQHIVKGIDALLEYNIPVNLRMIVDKENVNELVELAHFAIARGWTKHPAFKTALGRNYELHHCQTNNIRLYSRIEMYKEIYHLVKQHPEILEFHKPLFSISKFLFENGELPNPLFDSCSGTKTEWAFDYAGKIYACTATVGNRGDELGTFYPEMQMNSVAIDEWQERDVLSIPECTNCNVRLACGGGCAAIAKNRTGSISAPDCRPVKELLEYGISLYSDIDITKL
ncbi:MAG: radical SAM protein [Cyclobacteriaceae bacterium]|nr:radical SAM protein [Cyclobacteriaceae bacterium]